MSLTGMSHWLEHAATNENTLGFLGISFSPLTFFIIFLHLYLYRKKAMTGIELYINQHLCDIENPQDFTVYLKRQLLNPSELSTKDAQRSYDITLPASATNNAIFGYINTEEVRGKFTQLYDAQLLVGGIKIFDGKFKLSEIAKGYYKGNLGVPAPLTVKDVFGNTTMTEAGKWEIGFKDETAITAYNTKENAECIFPFVLYSLLNKTSYKDKTVIDSTVRYAIQDFPPSVNCIKMLQKIFKNAGYNLSGTAINDERLRQLYVSYKNANNYEMPYTSKKATLSVKWSNYTDKIESKVSFNTIDGYFFYGCDLLNSDNLPKLTIEDESDIIQRGSRTTIKVPLSGLYKIVFNANIRIDGESNLNKKGVDINGKDYHVISHQMGVMGSGGRKINLNDVMLELKVVRNASGNYDLEKAQSDNTFYKNNQDQEIDQNEAIFPQSGAVNFIDKMQNPSMLCGFSWGIPNNNSSKKYKNPLDSDGIRCNPIAIKSGESWNNKNSENDYSIYSAVNSPYYPNTDKYRVELNNAPDVYVNRDADDMGGNGQIAQIVWLEKGETLSVISTSSYWDFYPYFSARGWVHQHIDFTLSIEPFRTDRTWLTMDDQGASSAPMNWDDPMTFLSDKLDLIKFLPTDTKIDDWIDNFCKAFNLILYNTDKNNFELNIKNKTLSNKTSIVIDLDSKTHVNQRMNQPLNLPSIYELGFTVDTSEEGYYHTMENKKDENTGRPTEEKIVNSGYSGKGEFHTGHIGGNKVSQTSNFSYCWYKELTDKNNNRVISIPVITEHNIWQKESDYEETAGILYYDKPQRFWFKSDLYPININNKSVQLALVSNQYIGNQKLILDYDNIPDSIMQNLFLLLDNSKNCTIIECYLTPEEYNVLDIALVRFNGDLYNVAEIDGYDPSARKKGILKLIPRIV